MQEIFALKMVLYDLEFANDNDAIKTQQLFFTNMSFTKITVETPNSTLSRIAFMAMILRKVQ
ncbi:MAG: hypothetical protein H7174_13505 [Flavobacterium sp.]|nr:hypothetical protein [Flavobacterium sp.]